MIAPLAFALVFLRLAVFASGQQIKTAGSNTCLGLANNALANGALAVNQPCTASTSPSQTWKYGTATVAGKTVLLTSNNFCLDVPSGNAYQGAPLQIWTCNTRSTNQFFAKDGNLIRWNGSPYCLDVYHGVSKGFANGLSIVLWTCDATNKNQLFTGPSTAAVTTSVVKTTAKVTTTSATATTSAPVSVTKVTTTTSTSSSSVKTTSTPVTKPALTSIFKPSGKRMLAWGYDSNVAGNIGSGSKISSYHHWEDNVITQMPAKDTFVPTYWGITKNASWAAVKATLGTKIPPVVMSFNEPDISTQANMDPALAAQVFYNEITVPFGKKGSNVVSPAVVWNLNGWLVPFMDRCNQLGCGIDAAGLHIYVSINGNVDAAVASAKSQVNTVWNAFGKPIILSEIGLTQSGGGTAAQIDDFVTKIGSWLDSTDYVLAWALSAVFAAGAGWDGYLNSNMAFFNTDESLTPLALKYMNSAY